MFVTRHQSPPLLDAHGRVHTNLRVSVTDRCNIRCLYCIPRENIRFMPRHELLTYEEITRFVRVVARLGVKKIRLTGGEPLVRADLTKLILQVADVPGIEDLALTTNGVLLSEQAADLRRAGLCRINISLDTLREETFQTLSRHEGLERVIEGIHTARRVGFDKIRLNAIAIKGLTEDEIVPLSQFSREYDLELRFIEFMPLDGDGQWETGHMLSGKIIRETIEAAFGPLTSVERIDPSQPSVDYQFADGCGRIGFINSVTQPFCDQCNRLRLTADGQVRNCLFSTEEWDVRELLRGGGTDEQIADLVGECVGAKKPGHGIDEPDFPRSDRYMYQIGG